MEPVPSEGALRYYVGSAYAKANQDMLTKPEQWSSVRREAGLFVHPVGFRPLGSSASRFDALFANKSFVIEESIAAAYMNPRHLLDHYIFVMKALPGWTCDGIFLYVESDRFYGDLEDLIRRYRDFIQPAKDMGIPVFFFFMLLDVWNPKNLLTWGRLYGGKPLWIYFATKVGASGIALDHPTWHWLENPKAVWKPVVYRELAIRVAKTTKAAGLKFAWALNGYSKSLAEVETMARQLQDRGVRPDMWLIDHFHQKTHPGTPETKPTVTGQAMTLIKGKF